MPPKKPDLPKTELTLGQHLLGVRIGLKLTLRDVEERTNKEISNAYLSQIENDKIKQPSPNILNALAELYKIDFANLMELAGYVTPSEKTAAGKRHGRAASFAEYNLTPEEQSALLDHLQFLRWKKKSGDHG